MKSKNMKVKVAAIDTLSAFTNLVGFNFDSSFRQVWPDLSSTIDDRSSPEPTISALNVLRRLFRSKELQDSREANFKTIASEITDFLKKAIQHEYSKVVYEGLRVSSSFLAALRNQNSATVDQQFSNCVN